MELARLAADRQGRESGFLLGAMRSQGSVSRRRVWFALHFRDLSGYCMSRFWGGKRGHRETSWETSEGCRRE